MSTTPPNVDPNEKSPETLDPNVRKKEIMENTADRIADKYELDSFESLSLLAKQTAETGDPSIAEKGMLQDAQNQQSHIDTVKQRLARIEFDAQGNISAVEGPVDLILKKLEEQRRT